MTISGIKAHKKHRDINYDVSPLASRWEGASGETASSPTPIGLSEIDADPIGFLGIEKVRVGLW